VIYLTDFFDAASRHHNDVMLLPAIRRVSGNDFLPAGQCTGIPRRTRTTDSWTAASRNAKPTFLRPTCGLQTAQISVLWITRSGLSWSIVSTTDKSIVWMNWNGGSLMSGEVLNSQFLTMLLTSGEEDVERVSTFWVQLVNWQFWFCPYLLHSHVTSLTVICLITKSCQQRWPIHSCSFYKVCIH